ncbi:hypothetical protein HA050_09130 [Iodobacter sp. HSC-16F04]|uniref:Uncharacterized protein n=1 Tax=Iodobacter violaceini TaxID=3044271 RepID=A0ABX0KUB6_9NEIS|nr:hypothetical protein [Iodobacter violacea]NHQ86278.1 hypothetical protein [Iodobacter violacea]
MESKPIWWEKTVEYKFILEVERNSRLDFAAPLSGVQENAGDGVFGYDSKIVLIEFKRSKNELASEHNKYTNYEDAVEALSGKDNHHFLVYGSCSKNNELCLHARNYFSQKKAMDVLDILNHGLGPSAFKSYLYALLALKKTDQRSSGTVGPESVASAVGVSTRGVSSISLSEYYRLAAPELYQELTLTQKNRSNNFDSSVPGL